MQPITSFTPLLALFILFGHHIFAIPLETPCAATEISAAVSVIPIELVSVSATATTAFVAATVMPCQAIVGLGGAPSDCVAVLPALPSAASPPQRSTIMSENAPQSATSSDDASGFDIKYMCETVDTICGTGNGDSADVACKSDFAAICNDVSQQLARATPTTTIVMENSASSFAKAAMTTGATAMPCNALFGLGNAPSSCFAAFLQHGGFSTLATVVSPVAAA